MSALRARWPVEPTRAILTVVTDPQLEGMTDAERAWVLDNEQLWQRAHAIVATQPHLDVSLVYHTLVNLRRTPSERLARGLRRGPIRAL